MILKIRKYTSNDAKETYELFYNTVHHINTKDYSKKQVDVWVVQDRDMEDWNTSLIVNVAYVVMIDDKIVGFGDADKSGYIDRLYVHHQYQNLGIATMLLSHLEDDLKHNYQREILTVDASITAKGFFGSKGYTEIKENKKKRDTETLVNYTMIKEG